MNQETILQQQKYLNNMIKKGQVECNHSSVLSAFPPASFDTVELSEVTNVNPDMSVAIKVSDSKPNTFP